MNIITIPYGNKLHYIRPDISLNKDGNDYFCPDNINKLIAVPFLWIRIEKPLKAVSARFASRYYNTIGYGVRLIAPELIEENNPVSWWLANSLNSTTFFGKGVDISNASEVLDEIKEASKAYDLLPLIAKTKNITETINTIIATVNSHTFLKIGDYITIDLLPDNNIIATKEPLPTPLSFGKLQFNIIW